MCNCWPRSNQASINFRFEYRDWHKKYKRSYCYIECTPRYPGSWSSQCYSRCSPKNSLGSHLRHKSHNWAIFTHIENMSSGQTHRDLYSWCRLMGYKSSSCSKHPDIRNTRCHWVNRVFSKHYTRTKYSWNNSPIPRSRANTERYTTSME